MEKTFNRTIAGPGPGPGMDRHLPGGHAALHRSSGPMRIQVSQGHAWITVSDLKRDWFLREGHGIDLPAGSIVVIEAARCGDVGYRLVESLPNQ